MPDLTDTILALARLVNKADKNIKDEAYNSALSWLREAKLVAYEALTAEVTEEN